MAGAAAIDDASYREQLAYLFERSAFYREKLAAEGLARPPRRAGSPRSRELPLTEKQELERPCTAANPFGAHLCAERSEIVRIYSTSGTTGTPSYIPLTAGDLDNWVTGSARSYAASGIAAGQRVVTTYNAGPFVAGAALAVVRAHRPLPHPGRHGQHRAPDARDRAAGARGRGAHALLRGLPRRVGAERDFDLRGSSVERVLVAGEPGGGEPAFRAKLEEGWGARVTEAMGIGDIGVSLWGECEQQDGMHLGARGFVHPELIDPGDGRGASRWTTAPPASSCSRTCSHRAAPLLRFRTRDHVAASGRAPAACGRTGPRVRCIGRTDDMLIVRGVNVFPSAVREVVSAFAPDVSGHILVRPRAPGVKQEPPLPVSVELARGRDGRRRARRRDPREAARRARRPDPRRARAVGEPAAQRIQVEARRALDGGADAEASEPGRPPHHDRRGRPADVDRLLGGRARHAVRLRAAQPRQRGREPPLLRSGRRPADHDLHQRGARRPTRAARRRTPAACTTSRSRSRRRPSTRRSSGSTSAASSTAASRTAASWTRSTSRTRSAC